MILPMCKFSLKKCIQNPQFTCSFFGEMDKLTNEVKFTDAPGHYHYPGYFFHLSKNCLKKWPEKDMKEKCEGIAYLSLD